MRKYAAITYPHKTDMRNWILESTVIPLATKHPHHHPEAQILKLV